MADIVSAAVEHFEAGRIEEAFELSTQFDRYQQDVFFKATGCETEEDQVLRRVLTGAYKIDKEKDPVKRAQMMQVYDTLLQRLEELRSKQEAHAS